MSDLAPLISIVIPTHNRCRSLQRTLDALRAQRYPAERMEIIVVADGCSDDTLPMLRTYQAACALRIIETGGNGAASARNRGAASARGQIVLFLDDDVEPRPALVAAHVQAHGARPGQVVLGPYLPLPIGRRGYFHQRTRFWWEEKFRELGAPGHRFTYQDLLSGNLSLDRGMFLRFGGFDAAFRKAGREDYEFGLRLIKAGIPFHYALEALADHHEHETSNLASGLRRVRHEGRSDVLIGQRHPEVIGTLALSFWRPGARRRQRLLQWLVFHAPHLGDRLAAGLGRQLPLLERAGLREQWGRLHNQLRLYWYWRGVAEEAGTPARLIALRREGAARAPRGPITCAINLAAGLEVAEQRLDTERPAAAHLWYITGTRRRHIGVLPAQPGAEPWRGAHLRPFLTQHLALPFLEALAEAGAIHAGPPARLEQLSSAIERLARWYGPARTHELWWEQYSQWARLDAE